MTIKTLTFIHELLKDETDRRLESKKYIFDLWKTAVQENNPNAEQIRDQYNKVKEKYYQAENALEEFEAKEW